MLLGCLLAACSATDFSFGPRSTLGDTAPILTAQPAVSGRTFGKGTVRVAMLLPLSGDAGLTSVGTSMANAAELAVGLIESNPNIADNITLLVKDTGATANGAAIATSQALSEGATLILGPLRSDQVTAAAGVARPAGVSVIGFSNNPGAAAPGVYLLNVLPETEVRRSLSYASTHGRKDFVGIFPNSDFGRIEESAFRQTVAALGLKVPAVYNYSSASEARGIIAQLVPLLKSGQADAVFLPDRASATTFGKLLAEAGIAPGSVQLIGSGDWHNDAAIANTPALAGAIFPAVDQGGIEALSAEYRARFGATPHPLATLAYTATILANASTLSRSVPRYDPAVLTIPTGFSGRDGAFRFFQDGRSEIALTIRQVTVGGSKVIDPAPTRFQ